MRLSLVAAAMLCVAATVAHAQGIVGPGHALGNPTSSARTATDAPMTGLLGASPLGTVPSRSVFYDMLPGTVAQMLAGTNTTPTGPGASGDLTTQVQATMNKLAAAGGTVDFPAVLGTFWVCGVTVPAHVHVHIAGLVEGTAACPTGPLLTASASGQGNAWTDITRMLQTNEAATNTSIVASGYTGDVQAGHAIYVQGDYDSGLNTAPLMELTVAFVTQNSPSAGLTTINFTSGLPYVASAGNPWRDVSDPQIIDVEFSGTRINGNVLNQTNYYSNIVNAVTPPTSGSVALNAASDIVASGKGFMYFGSNVPVRFCTTANESANITITGHRRMSNFSEQSLTQTEALPNNGCGVTDVNHWFQDVTAVSVSANMNGSLFVGIPYGQQSDSCLTLSSPNYNLRDLVIKDCKGFGWVSNWTAGNGGFNSPIAGPLATADNINISVAEQGLGWINGPNDCKFEKIIGGYSFNIGFWIDRQGGGCNITDGHVYFGTPGAQYSPVSPNWMQAYHGWLVDGDSVTFSNTKAEQAASAQMLIRANNVNVRGGLFFDNFAVGSLGQQSACFEIGDNNYNTAGVAEYIIDSQCKGPGGSGVFFANDGGLGYIHLVGDDYATTLGNCVSPGTCSGSNYSTGSTAVILGCGACGGLLSAGMQIVITLNSGVQQVTLGAYTAGSNTWSITALTGAANATNIAYRGIGANGTVYTGGSKSTMAFEMYQAYQGYFAQTAP